MSWNLSLKVNNLINKVNSIIAGTVTNPLNASLNASGFDITNIGQLATSNLSAPTGGSGAYGQKLTKNTSNSGLAWATDRQVFSVYVSSQEGVDLFSNQAGSITSPYQTIQYAIINLASTIPIGAKCVVYLYSGSYSGFTLDTTLVGQNFNRLTNISFVGMTNTLGTSNTNLSASNTNSVTITSTCDINVENTIAAGTTINNYNISMSNINFTTTNSRILRITGKNHCVYMNNCNAVCTLNSVPSFPVIDINAIAGFSIHAYFNNCNISHNSSTNYSAGSDNSLLKCNRGIIKELNNCYLYSTPINSQPLFITNAGSLEYVYNTTIISNSYPNALHINSTSQTNATFNLCTMTANGDGTQPIVNLGHLNGTYTITNCIIKNSLITNPSTIYIGVGSNIILYSIKNRFESEATTDQTFNPFGLSSTYAPAKTNNIIGYNNDTFINKLFTTSNTIAFPALSTNFTAINEINTYLTGSISVVFYVDGTVGKNTYNGSQSYPFKTIQYALSKCVGITLYYTIFVNAGTYAENLTITCPRLNLIGVQSSVNTKTVALQTVTINTAAISGPSLDIISIQNFVIGSAAVTTYPIMANYTIANSGGYSLYVTNCEIISSLTFAIMYLTANNIANTRYYISRCNIQNIASGTPGDPLIFVGGGSLWSFDNNNITNRAPSNTIGNEIVPIYIGQSGGIINGISNCNFTSENQGMCIATDSTNGNLPFSISNTFFSFKTINQGSGASNVYSCITLGAKNTINLINSTFVNTAITSAFSQQPFILLSAGSTVYSRNNSFNMTYAPINAAQAIIYPVGNYGINATLNFYVYLNNVYSNGSSSIIPIPNYPSSATIFSSLQTSDLNTITNLTKLTSATKANVVGYDTTTGLLTYQPTGSSGIPTYLYYFPDTSTNVSSTSITTYSWNSPSQFASTTQTFISNQLTFLNYNSVPNIETSNWTVSQAGYTSTGWGNTVSTAGKFVFPATGQYVINWCFQANSNLNVYGQINKNMPLPASGQPSFNTQTMITCNNPVSPGSAFSAIVNIASLTDYITFTVFNFNPNQSINVSGRQVLSIVRVA